MPDNHSITKHARWRIFAYSKLISYIIRELVFAALAVGRNRNFGLDPRRERLFQGGGLTIFITNNYQEVFL